MSSEEKDSFNYDFHALTSERWADLEMLFGERGACGGCWCMYWRLGREEFRQKRGELNRKALKSLVDSGLVPGILAYTNGQPVGWVSVAPRETLSRLDSSRALKRVDDKPVWSVVCFFVAKPFRRRGLSVKLLEAAVDYVKEKGGKIIEGYPVDPQKDWPAPFVYTGATSAFQRAGFKEVIRRSKARPIMRYTV